MASPPALARFVTGEWSLASSGAAASLPVQLTTFIGREREIATVRDLLRGTRLLTLTGSGGSGKTRLAREVAAAVAEDFPNGVTWVDLGSLTTPELLAGQVAAALGVIADSAASPVASIIHAIRELELLVVLDNCEHLIDACAQLASSLLRHASGVRILATSREALAVGGERAWLVPALSLPPVEERSTVESFSSSEAVQLFVERARDVLPTFALTPENAAAVAQICRRLDGLPLALELAAARVRVLAPDQIAERLDDAFRLLGSAGRRAMPRHRTLREAIDWSFALLSDDERRLLRRLSVFPDSFTLTAVETICVGDGISAGEVLDLLAALVDKSLVSMQLREGEARYRLLETIRQYAAERLRDSGEESTVRDRHAQAMIALAERLEPRLMGGIVHPAAVAELDGELPGLRAAADWLTAEHARADGALRLGWALRWYWFARGLLVEGYDRLSAALAIADAASPLARAKGLSAMGLVRWWQGDHEHAVAPMEESVPLLRDAGEPRLHASALIVLGMVAAATGEHEKAARVLDDAVAGARSVDHPLVLVYAVFQRGLAAAWRRDFAMARASLSEAVALARDLGHRSPAAHALSMLANVAYETGERAEALAHAREVLSTMRETGERWGAVQVLHVLLRDAEDRRDHERLARLLGVMEGFRKEMGARVAPMERESLDRQRRIARGVLGEDGFERLIADGRALGFESAIDFALEPVALEAPPVPSIAVLPVAPAITAAGPSLVVRALGPLSIEVDGRPLPASAWPFARPRELFLYLLLHPDGRTREQIGLTFWPDASASQLKNSFHVTLHHLRKALGKPEWILFEDERYRVDRLLDREVDFERFGSGVTRALRELRAGTPGAPDRLRDALALYRGDLLEEENAGDWHLEHRDQLRRLWLDGMLAMGTALLREERYADAAGVYRQIVIREELHEESYRQLMISEARRGDRAAALRHYERLTVLLRDEIDAEPEEETVELADRIRKSAPV